MITIQIFKNNLVVSPFADGKFWYLVEDFEWQSNRTGESVTVPKGFVTDFTSTPRLLWVFLPSWAQYGPAAVVHDYLYWEQYTSRKQADKLMRDGMEELDVCPLSRRAIYRALRLAGWYTWWKNGRSRKKGEKKVIAQFPERLSQTWADYRKNPDVF